MRFYGCGTAWLCIVMCVITARGGSVTRAHARGVTPETMGSILADTMDGGGIPFAVASDEKR